MSTRDGHGLEQSMSPARPERDLSGALSLSIEGITFIGNIFPILVIFCVKKSTDRTVTDILIGALAFTDILAVLAPLPVSLPTFICQDRWKKGPAACHYYQFCVFWLQNVASLLVIAMSMERVFALAMPLRYKSWSKRYRVYLTIAGIFLSTFVVSCLPLFGLAPDVMPVKGGRSPFCRSWASARSDTWYQSVFPLVLIVEFWTNMLIVLILNSFLVFYLVRFGRKLKPSSGTDKIPGDKIVNGNCQIDRRDFYEFSKLVVVVAVLFYCTWLPVLVVMTLTQSGYFVSELVAVYALISTTLNGLFNPFIYLVLSRQYRDGYVVILTKLWRFCCPAQISEKCCCNYPKDTLNERHLSDIKLTASPPAPNEIIIKITVI
ncbi:adenosine receptor A3-like [Amphiura filiformis]|uniref:adenosine receptor A3-like n=1 Tax=Amphiura filiformis TaxID=82378 RepID=UPI003B2184D9